MLHKILTKKQTGISPSTILSSTSRYNYVFNQFRRHSDICKQKYLLHNEKLNSQDIARNMHPSLVPQADETFSRADDTSTVCDKRCLTLNHRLTPSLEAGRCLTPHYHPVHTSPSCSLHMANCVCDSHTFMNVLCVEQVSKTKKSNRNGCNCSTDVVLLPTDMPGLLTLNYSSENNRQLTKTVGKHKSSHSDHPREWRSLLSAF